MKNLAADLQKGLDDGDCLASVACHCDAHEMNRHLLSVKEAQALAIQIVPLPTKQELVPLVDALGRVAAKKLHAPNPMPFFDSSAMDGYAVQTTNLVGNGPFTLRVSGKSVAGISGKSSFEPRMAVRIFTGALVPDGLDAVIAQENCRLDNGDIEFDQIPQRGANIRYRGSDVERGACLIQKGTRIQPHHTGLLAANGYSAVNVFAMPRIGVFSTGDELARPGQSLKIGQIYDCNKPMLIALFATLGIDAVDLGALPDDPEATRAFLAEKDNAFDLLVSSGSVSVGDRDFLKPAFQAVGGSIENWKVAIKPGKPIMFGRLGRTVFTGLPGNPFAVFVGFNLFVKPQIARFCGHVGGKPEWQVARAGFAWNRKPGRTEVFPVKRRSGPANSFEKVERLGNSVSATLYPLSGADGLAMVPADCAEIAPGDLIQWQPFC